MLFITLLAPWPGSKMDEKSTFKSDQQSPKQAWPAPMGRIESDQLLPILKCCIQCSVPYSLDEVYNEKIMLFITLLATWPGSRLDENNYFQSDQQCLKQAQLAPTAQIEPDQLLPFMKCCIQCSVPYSLNEAYNEKRMLFITLLATWPGSRLDEKSNKV